jgi:hypothetical protein
MIEVHFGELGELEDANRVRVVVGSTNPVKVAAATAVLRRVYGDGVDAEVGSLSSVGKPR